MKTFLQKKYVLGLTMLLLLAIPCISHANPIVFADLYSPFSSDFVMYTWVGSLIFPVGLALELILIFLFIRKYINREQKKKAVLKISISIVVLNLFTMWITQGIALFIAFFAELFPIIVEYFIICSILRKAKRKGLLINLPTKKTVFIIVFFANLLSFGFGLVVNLSYSNCERSDRHYILDSPSYFDNYNKENLDGIHSYCFYMPSMNKILEEYKYMSEKRIDECDKLLDLSGDLQHDCYVNYAIEKNDLEYCRFPIRETDFKFGEYSLYKRKEENICYVDIALKTLDHKYCDNIHDIGIYWEDDVVKAQCYIEVAIAKKDYSICKEIEDIYKREKNWRIKDIINRCYSKARGL